MARHSFVRTTKLTDVQGRVDYISNPKRQEHLYAFYGTVAPEFWQRLSEQAQFDFWRSHQKTGKCIEARELIIALPESLQASDPKKLLEQFTEKFRSKYGVQCAAALHHNKAMTNYHIHLVFADRDVLEKTEVKRAARNMFFDEDGQHVRTKKEILDEHGNVRPSCRILVKGGVYDIKWFSGRKDIFKSRGFLPEAKQMYTDLINQLVSPEERQQVFDASSPYLPTKKIGKNNPLEDVITADNELRQEWNRTVDQVLIAGGSHEEVTEFKTEEITSKVSESIQKNGNDPSLFSQIIRFAIAVLQEFLDLLMRNTLAEIEKTKETSEKQDAVSPKPETETAADLRNAEAEFMPLDAVHQKLNKANRKLYALQKQQKSMQDVLDTTPRDLFHRKERKALEDRIDGIGRQIDLTRTQMEAIPKQHGFDDVKSAEAAYKAAKAKLESLKETLGDTGKEEFKIKPRTQKQKVSALKELAARRLEAQQREAERRRSGNGKKGVEEER